MLREEPNPEWLDDCERKVVVASPEEWGRDMDTFERGCFDDGGGQVVFSVYVRGLGPIASPWHTKLGGDDGDDKLALM